MLLACSLRAILKILLPLSVRPPALSAHCLLVPVDNFDDLHQDIVQECAGAKAKESRREPVVAQRFLYHDQISKRLSGSTNPAGRFYSDPDSSRVKVVANRFQYYQCYWHGSPG